MQKWEYRVEDNGGVRWQKESRQKQLGEEGWELVATDGDSLYFKRPLSG